MCDYYVERDQRLLPNCRNKYWSLTVPFLFLNKNKQVVHNYRIPKRKRILLNIDYFYHKHEFIKKCLKHNLPKVYIIIDGSWSLPGGIIRQNEKIIKTVEREFSEEALGSLDLSDEEKNKTMSMVKKAFGMGITVLHISKTSITFS